MYKTLSVITFISLIILTVTLLVPDYKLLSIKPVATDLPFKEELISFPVITAVILALPLMAIFPFYRASTRKDKTKRNLYLLGFYCAICLTLGISEMLKFTIEKKRPDYDARLSNEKTKESSKESSKESTSSKPGKNPHVIRDATKSFPSGHTSGSFALVLPFTYYIRRENLKYSQVKTAAAFMLLNILATLVGVSRIHDNKHELVDVGFGVIVALVSSLAVVELLSRRLERLEKENSEENQDN